MPAEPDHAALLAGLHTLVDRANAGESVLLQLNELIDVACGALGAAGMLLTEYAPEQARVVAAVRASEWTAGRPVPLSCRDFHLGAGAQTWEATVADLPDAIAQQLAGRGLHRLLGARVVLGDELIGGLHAYFQDPEASISPAHHRMLRFIGACVAGMYGLESRLVAAAAAAPAFDKELFIAVTSHELRTPVTVMKGFVDTLDRHWEALDAAQRREAVRVIGQRTNELARLVDRLLATATATDPAGLPICTPFDLVAALCETASSLRPELRARLKVKLPPHLPKAYGDRASLPTVLTELVTNATKYSESDVELSAAADEQSVVFQVADHGIGIKPEHVTLAFVRYWQAETGDRSELSGAGLGLHLVRQIVERQKGWVSLRPRDSGGTVAEVRLPRADAVGPQ